MLPLQTVCCCYDKKNRLLEHNTYLTLPYSPFLSDSDKIYRDSSSIHHLVSRKNDYSGRHKKSPSRNKFRTCPRTHWNRLPFKSNSASTVAALLKDIHSGGGCCCGCCYYPKSRGQTKQKYINLQGGSSLFYDQNFTPVPRRRRKKTKKTTTSTSKP